MMEYCKWVWFTIRMVMAVMGLLLLLERCTTEGCLEHERIALLQLKPFFNRHNDLYNWDEVKGSDCCEWERVECNTTTKRVIGLSLNDTRYNIEYWYLNASLFLPFEELKSLDLSWNAITGCVENEGFAKLSTALGNLEMLDLTSNHLNDSILLSLSELSSLRYLYLAETQLKGSSHPNGLNHLTNLKYLDLSQNRIESISNQDETQLRLEELDLSNNLFRNNTISFPKGLSTLKSLNLQDNRLQGSLDIKELSRNLINLKKLDLSWNQIESLQSFKDLDAFTNLRELDMSRNQLKDFVIHKENKESRKLEVVRLDDVSTNGSISLQNLVEAFSSVKTISLYDNNLNMTMTTQVLNGSSNVEEINLDFSSLNTNILQSIGVLFTSLKTLSLSNCGLAGSLPNQGWSDLRNLQVLDVSWNSLEGMLPHCLGNLTSLRELYISNNQFTGNLTPLANLTSLRSIFLSRNHFQIPMSLAPLANLQNLKFLFIDENKMVMEPSFSTSVPKFQLKFIRLSKCITSQQQLISLQLPTFLYYQYDLRYVDLSRNNFSGTVPIWLLENNTKLEFLMMMGNSFTGPLSLLSVPPTFNVSSIDISDNKLGGLIPTDICSTFPHLRGLFLSNNAFQGNIPPCLSGMKDLLYLDLSNNQLSGRVPQELIMKSSLSTLRLSNNNLSGNVVRAILNTNGLQHLYLDGNNFCGEMTNVDVSTFEFPTSLADIDLSNNKFYGKLPRWLGNALYLQRLALSNNSFEGSIPMEFCNLYGLNFLDLSQNNSSGSIPFCFNPPNIEHVHLHGNRLSGPLSLAFYNSSSLVTLDLSGNNLSGGIPKWVGTLSSLSVLLLKANHFHGRIPIQLCKLYLLSIIDLSQNMFYGPIPSCLGNLTLPTMVSKITQNEGYVLLFSEDDDLRLQEYLPYYYPKSYIEEWIELTTKSVSYSYGGYILQNMAGIDLSCNNLTGHIPPQLGNLNELHSLNLSNNKLTGAIPFTFSKFEQIESLDLSHNNLSGAIPNQLVELKSLAVFSVAHNNLLGSIPDPKAQFGTFTESSYEGNPFLCGPLLHKTCSKTDSPSTVSTVSNDDDEGEDGLLDTSIFCVSFLVSYVVMLLTVVVVLYINPYWRRAWFSFVRKCITTCRYSTVGNLLVYYISRRCV